MRNAIATSFGIASILAVSFSYLVGCFLFLASALSAAESAAGNRRFVIVFPN